MNKSLLVIQFRENKSMLLTERQSFRKRFAKSGVKISFINIFDENLEWNNPQKVIGSNAGIILGGSGDFDFDGGRAEDDPKKKMSYEILGKIRTFLEYLFDNNIPTLGICYGHQMLAAFKGTEIINDKQQSKAGSHEVSIVREYKSNPLLKDLPSNFIAQYGHKDSLKSLPKGATVIAQGQKCNYSILAYSSNIYSVQFHPELKSQDMLKRFKKTTSYLPEGADINKSIKLSTYSELILRNFAKISFSSV